MKDPDFTIRDNSSNFTILLDKALLDIRGPDRGLTIQPDGNGGLKISIQTASNQHVTDTRGTTGESQVPKSATLTLKLSSGS
jgi:hypothetical protein